MFWRRSRQAFLALPTWRGAYCSASATHIRFDTRYSGLAATTIKGFATKSEEHDSWRKRPSAIAQRLPDPDSVNAPHRFREFELDNRVFVVTGGAQGLGLTLAEALVEAGGHVYCLDRQSQPSQSFLDTKDRLAHRYEGSLTYRKVDVQYAEELDDVIASIAAEHSRLDGLIAAAGIQYVKPALEYPPSEIPNMMNINFGGVMLSAVSCARQMIKYKTPGSMVLIGSMSGLNANKGFTSSVYNASKAAVIQLGRNLAMEWGKIIEINGQTKAIRVNVLCPGNIMLTKHHYDSQTPMVEKNFADDPGLRKIWEEANMMGRISEMHEYRGAALFMLSDASSFMTGSHVVIDGGYTAW